MSGNLYNLLSLVRDEGKPLALVKAITEKTVAGKIAWTRTPSSFVANASGLQITFVKNPGVFKSEDWERFTVTRTSDNKELLNEASGPLFFGLAGSALSGGAFPPVPAPPSALDTAISQLFAVVTKAAPDDLDSAINTIKKL